MKEVKTKSHRFGMNQKCHNGLWILRIEVQFWRKKLCSKNGEI
jgi:hypothetical protein